MTVFNFSAWDLGKTKLETALPVQKLEQHAFASSAAGANTPVEVLHTGLATAPRFFSAQSTFKAEALAERMGGHAADGTWAGYLAGETVRVMLTGFDGEVDPVMGVVRGILSPPFVGGAALFGHMMDTINSPLPGSEMPFIPNAPDFRPILPTRSDEDGAETDGSEGTNSGATDTEDSSGAGEDTSSNSESQTDTDTDTDNDTDTETDTVDTPSPEAEGGEQPDAPEAESALQGDGKAGGSQKLPEPLTGLQKGPWDNQAEDSQDPIAEYLEEHREPTRAEEILALGFDPKVTQPVETIAASGATDRFDFVEMAGDMSGEMEAATADAPGEDQSGEPILGMFGAGEPTVDPFFGGPLGLVAVGYEDMFL